MTKEEMKKTLLKSVATVTFTKADGSERILKCTLQESFFPIVEQTEAVKKVKKENLETLSVWDIENSGWRSFRLDSVTKFDFSI